jgi:RNA polymerase sigma factor (sigma-70 family)
MGTSGSTNVNLKSMCDSEVGGVYYAQPMSEDAQLLGRYAAENSDAAFTEFVARHINLVYAAALRRLGGDSHHASDVTQQVFIAAARNARSLTRHGSIVGWLYTTTRNAALNLMREEQRRRQRERATQTDTVLTGNTAATTDSEIDWARLRPLLDDAMDALGARDREVVLLRFFSGMRLGEIGARLNVSENTARMRVQRALEKLQALLARRGLTSTATALGSALTHHTGATVPAGLAASVSTAALSATAGAGAGAATTLLAFIPGPMTSIITLAMLTGAIVLNLGPQRVNAQLHRTLAALEHDERESANVRAERQRLNAEFERRGELGRLTAELETLRGKMGSARPRRPFSGFSRLTTGGRHLDVTPATPRREIIAFLHPDGLSSPMRAWQTMRGAGMGTGKEMELQEATFCFDEKGAARLDEFMAALPETARTSFRIRESLVAPVFDQWLWKGNEPQRYSPDRDVPVPGDPTRADSYFKITYASGETRVDRFPFKRFDDGWRFGPLTESDAEELLDLLDPRTGRPKQASPSQP